MSESMTVDRAIELVKKFGRGPMADTFRQAACVLADEVERLRNAEKSLAAFSGDVLGSADSVIQRLSEGRAALQARVAELEKREAAYDIILKVVSTALERAGVTECDNPADAIDMIAKERDGLAAKCAELIHYPDCWDLICYPTIDRALENIDHRYQGCTECSEKSKARIKAEAVREFADQTGDHYVINMAIDYNKANQIEGGT